MTGASESEPMSTNTSILFAISPPPSPESAVLAAMLPYGVPEGHLAQSGDESHGKGVSSLAEVKIQEGESIESALRRFKRKVQQEDIIKDIKKHSFYLKPGDKRRAKQALARKRSRKKQRRDTE
jgi:small subunit ribosomal protein S21